MESRQVIFDSYRRNDIIVITEPHFFAWFIRRCQRRCRERYTREEARAWHVGLIDQWPVVRESLVLKGVTETDYSLPGMHRGYRVFRNLTRPVRPMCELCDPVHHMRHLERGHGIYDMAAIVGMYLMSFGIGSRVDNLLDKADMWFCSEAVAEAFKRAGWPLPTDLKPSAMWPAEIIRLWHLGYLAEIVNGHTRTVASEPCRCVLPIDGTIGVFAYAARQPFRRDVAE